MTAIVIPFRLSERDREYDAMQRLLRDIMADGHELPQFPGGIDDLPFEELGDRPHLDLIFTEPKR